MNSLEAGGKVVKSRSKSRRREKFEGKSRVSFVFKEFVEMSMGNTFQPKQEKLASVRLADMFSTNITVSVRSILDSSRNQQTKTL